MKNKEIAEMFYEMADVLELRGVQWKPNAYRKAARSLEGMSEPVEKVYEKGGLKALKDIPGVGTSLAEKIEEFLKTGKMKEYKKVVKKVPKGVEEMMHVPGLGPKKVMVLYEKLKIKSLAQLKKAAEKGKLRKLEGFGEKTEKDILRGLELVRKGQKRKLLGVALPIARDLCERLSKVDGVSKVEPAGSVRRMKETVGDIDILAISSKPEKVMKAFTSFDEVESIIAKGKTKSTVILAGGLQADLRVLEQKSFGAALQYFTGSKDHNVKLRQIAIKKGYKLSEYGLFKKKKYVCGKSEQELYRKLGMAWIPPELRTNAGEIEAAQKKKLPKLVEVRDIKGDLHMHSKWSDGADSILEMVRAAEERGYKYVAMTDHSKGERIANGMDEKRLMKYLKKIDEVQKKVDIRILKGSEVNILKDGSLDYADKYLKQLDVVVASVHSGFKSPKAEMTKRVLKALENPYVNIVGHPTGRKIHQREPFAIDLERVAAEAKKQGVALEVDAQPARLDLNDAQVRMALENGGKIAIDADSHSKETLWFMEMGVAQARRGWAEKKDVINTFTLRRLEKFLRR